MMIAILHRTIKSWKHSCSSHTSWATSTRCWPSFMFCREVQDEQVGRSIGASYTVIAVLPDVNILLL
uniref:Uncharacterized protein n=1 Tax=Aegilops tauschii subsp. strangulata TaxID=200361 RepID=A0A453I4C0_AEGTS